MAQDPVAESKEEKSEEFEFWIKWDDIEPSKNGCRYTTVDDKTFDVCKRGFILYKSHDGTFQTDAKLPLPLAIQKLLKEEKVTLPFGKFGNVVVKARSKIVEQALDIPNLVMCMIEGERENGNSAFGGVWYFFGSNEDLENGDLEPMISGEKVNVIAKSTTHLPTLAQKIDYCGRFGFEQMIVQQMKDTISKVLENGSIEQLCKLYNVVEDNPEEALRELLTNIM